MALEDPSPRQKAPQRLPTRRPKAPPRQWQALTLLLPVAILAASCAPSEPPRPAPPIVLITFEGLPAASVGQELTPSLQGFFEEADWAGQGIASSGRADTAAASLVTGLNPWRHRLQGANDVLAPQLYTLAEALSDLGYTTSGYFAGSLAGPHGFQQGFGYFRTLLRGRGAQSHLRSLGGESELVWIHLQHPSPPWIRRDWLFPAGGPPSRLPRRVDPEDLAPYRSPAIEPPEAQRRVFEALYRNNVSLADVLLGRLLQHLRESGHWNDALVAVTSTQGQELGGTRADPIAGGLSRGLLEVPLALKLPRDWETPLAVAEGERVATARLFATLVEAAGGRSAPGVAPSLFQPTTDRGVLSEGYLSEARLSEGYRVSWLEGDHQLLWTLHGSGASGDRILLRWSGDAGGGTEPVAASGAGAEVQDRLTEELRREWTMFVPVERSPARRLGS